MKTTIKALIAAATLVLVVAACGNDDNKRTASDDDTEFTISGISDEVWTYISLEDNVVVGTSPKDDPEADSQWAGRSDWDIAICGDMVRTNSGTSGNGHGGIRRIDDKSYEDVTASDAGEVDADSPQPPGSFR